MRKSRGWSRLIPHNWSEKTMHELDTVVLVRDVAEHGLKQGDVGAIAHRYGEGEAFEVEFVTGEGETVVVMTLERDDVRPMEGREILHARPLATA